MLLSGTLTKAKIIDAVTERNGFTRTKAREYIYRPNHYSIMNMSAKATKKRLNFNPSRNDDLMLDPKRGENFNYWLG